MQERLIGLTSHRVLSKGGIIIYHQYHKNRLFFYQPPSFGKVPIFRQKETLYMRVGMALEV